MSSDSLFLVMTQLLSELKDGHVNLSSSFDYGHYWKWYEDYPLNLSLDLRRKYLGHDYRIAGGLKYRRLTYNGHAPDSIGYIVYESFGKPISNSNISGMLSRLTECKALIIDIRGNAHEGAKIPTKERFGDQALDHPGTAASPPPQDRCDAQRRLAGGVLNYLREDIVGAKNWSEYLENSPGAARTQSEGMGNADD